jgi:nicotinate-nucleotide adenylyltransferase
LSGILSAGNLPDSNLPAPGLLALFGGTFDPVHNAHLAVAKAAFSLEAGLIATGLRLFPVGNPYQRGRAAFASAEHRTAMLKLAFVDMANIANVEIDPRELDRQGPTYTFDTLSELRNELGMQRPFVWLIGSDAFARLDTWHRWQELFDLTHFAVIVRPGFAFSAEDASPTLRAGILARQCDAAMLKQTPHGKWALLNVSPPDVSSTEVRARLAHGESIASLVPDVVCGYIEAHNLYRS